MPYCDNKKLIFLHIPKTGGTTIKNLFGLNQLDEPGTTNIPSPQHLTCAQLRKRLGPDKYDSYYKFTFVRNPWARIVSHYNWRQHLAESWSAPPFADFLKYVQKVVQEECFYEEEYGDHFIPQDRYTNDVNNIFKFENFEESINILANRFDVETNSFQPKTPEFRDCYMEYYNSSSQKIIAQIYRKEIEQFGYEFEAVSAKSIAFKQTLKADKKLLAPSFSVVIPSYNLGITLRRTVDSVLAQSLSGIELIIVDDASSDKNTIDFLKTLDYTSIRVIFLKKNGGVAHARNTGIKAATAPYILCLDSDDYISPDYLQKAKKIFDDKNEIGIVSPWLKLFGEYEAVWECRENFSIQELLEGNRLPSGSCVRKKVYEEINYYDDNRELSGLDDWDLWIRIFTQTKWKQTVIPEPLFFYRIQKNSQGHSMSDEKLDAALRVIIRNNSTYIQNHTEDEFVCRHITATRNRLQRRGLLHKEERNTE